MPATSQPTGLTLEFAPSARFDLVDLRNQFAQEHHDQLGRYPRCVYWSYHTTAGFLDRSLASRLLRQQGIASYVEAYRTLFPEAAGYEHDRLDRRDDLDANQRKVEPRNGDSHLAYMAAGLRACVEHPNRPGEAVCYIDLDGMHEGRARRRLTHVVGYHYEEEVARLRIEVPASGHPIDSLNLKDPSLGLYERIADLIAANDVQFGRLRLSLAHGERTAGLTVNEYETLLMRHDLASVLRDPLRFALEKGRHILADPRAVPAKTLGYARYDFVQVMNRIFDLLGLRQSLAERLVAKALAIPAARVLRLKRSLSMLVSPAAQGGKPVVIEGKYQSPILVQWQLPASQTRLLDVTLTRLV